MCWWEYPWAQTAERLARPDTNQLTGHYTRSYIYVAVLLYMMMMHATIAALGASHRRAQLISYYYYTIPALHKDLLLHVCIYVRLLSYPG